LSVQLASKISNLCGHDPATSQTDGRTYRQTDGQTTCNVNTALCTIVRRAVKIHLNLPNTYIVVKRAGIALFYNVLTVLYVCQTTLSSSIVRNLSPQLWHQFRITAVNIYGSQGPSEPSSPFSLLFGLSKYLRVSNNNNNNNNNNSPNHNPNHSHNLDNEDSDLLSILFQ